MRVTELYSGLGGFHLAVEASGVLKNSTLHNAAHGGPDEKKKGVQAAFDMNEIANSVYKHNFGESVHISSRNVLFLKPGDPEFENCVANADLLLLSPPCQPYTRRKLNPMCSKTLEGDEDRASKSDRSGKSDARALSVHHLIDLMHSEGKPLPESIFIENVLGFEKSETFMRLYQMFKHHGYYWQGIVMTPIMLGIPNSRPRLFVAAKRSPFGNAAWNECIVQEKTEEREKKTLKLSPKGAASGGINTAPADEEPPFTRIFLKPGELIHILVNIVGVEGEGLIEERMIRALAKLKAFPEIGVQSLSVPSEVCLSLKSYMRTDLTERERKGTEIPASTLWKAGNMFDIVLPNHCWSNCFTKSYSRFQLGAGSVVCSGPFVEDVSTEVAQERVAETYKKFFERRNEIVHSERFKNLAGSSTSKWSHVAEWENGCSTLESLGLRYFAPREIAALMGFPASYSFPENMSFKQCFALLGNSLNVKVVAFLLRYMMNTYLEHSMQNGNVSVQPPPAP